MCNSLLKAATNAHNTIEGIYKWVDMVEEAGGVTCISGVSKAHAMFESLKKNRKRLDDLITEPLLKAIKEAKEHE
jgi:hypothetical protein